MTTTAGGPLSPTSFRIVSVSPGFVLGGIVSRSRSRTADADPGAGGTGLGTEMVSPGRIPAVTVTFAS